MKNNFDYLSLYNLMVSDLEVTFGSSMSSSTFYRINYQFKINLLKVPRYLHKNYRPVQYYFTDRTTTNSVHQNKADKYSVLLYNFKMKDSIFMEISHFQSICVQLQCNINTLNRGAIPSVRDKLNCTTVTTSLECELINRLIH